jgi:predicted MFS family arabinose efflux permease
MLFAALPVLAFQRYADPKVAGWLLMGFGLGGVVGTVAAFRLVTKVEPLKLASVAALGIALPLWLLPLNVPLAFMIGAIAASAFCNPSVNSPFFGALTARTPPALLPKVMAALITIATIAGPVGLLLAGWLLQHFGLRPTFVVVAVGQTFTAVTFSALVLRYRRAQRAQSGEPFATAIVSDSLP